MLYYISLIYFILITQLNKFIFIFIQKQIAQQFLVTIHAIIIIKIMIILTDV